MEIINSILYPLTYFIYLILVTIPGVAMYLLLTILDLLSSVFFDQLLGVGGDGAKIFGTVLGFGTMFFVIGYGFAIAKAMIFKSKQNQGRDNDVLSS